MNLLPVIPPLEFPGQLQTFPISEVEPKTIPAAMPDKSFMELYVTPQFEELKKIVFDLSAVSTVVAANMILIGGAQAFQGKKFNLRKTAMEAAWMSAVTIVNTAVLRVPDGK